MVTPAPVGTVATARVAGTMLRGPVSSVVMSSAQARHAVAPLVGKPPSEAVDVGPVVEAVDVPASVAPPAVPGVFAVSACPLLARAYAP